MASAKSKNQQGHGQIARSMKALDRDEKGSVKISETVVFVLADGTSKKL